MCRNLGREEVTAFPMTNFALRIIVIDLQFSETQHTISAGGRRQLY